MKAMARDFYKAAQGKVSVLEIPTMQFLMVDGQGDPTNSVSFRQATQALYTLSFRLKFALKKAEGLDYKVGGLEGLWWLEGDEPFDLSKHLKKGQDRSNWRWTLMVNQPDAITPDWFAQTRKELGKKNLPALEQVRLERFQEGVSGQTLHIGPYAEEAPTIALLVQTLEQQGYTMNGKHHEVYLGDPSRAAPEKLRTLIRHPVRRA
jgi:hypothetical protein